MWWLTHGRVVADTWRTVVIDPWVAKGKTACGSVAAVHHGPYVVDKGF